MRPETAEAGERSEPGALAGIRILIVDDDRDMCDALRYLLESCGAEVRTAASAADALAAIERSRPDVLLSDVVMPGESGYDLIRKIAAREGVAAGFRTLLAKPIDPEALVAVVADLAGRRLSNSSRTWP